MKRSDAKAIAPPLTRSGVGPEDVLALDAAVVPDVEEH